MMDLMVAPLWQATLQDSSSCYKIFIISTIDFVGTIITCSGHSLESSNLLIWWKFRLSFLAGKSLTDLACMLTFTWQPDLTKDTRFQTHKQPPYIDWDARWNQIWRHMLRVPIASRRESLEESESYNPTKQDDCNCWRFWCRKKHNHKDDTPPL